MFLIIIMFQDKNITFPVKKETASFQTIIKTDGGQFYRTVLLRLRITEIPSCVWISHCIFLELFPGIIGSH